MTPELLVVSPMTRTLQTASFSFPNLVDNCPWLAIEDIREASGFHPCDRRQTLSGEDLSLPAFLPFSLPSSLPLFLPSSLLPFLSPSLPSLPSYVFLYINPYITTCMHYF